MLGLIKGSIYSLLTLAVFANVAWADTGDGFCNNYLCINVTLKDDGTAQVQLRASSSAGWLGFGVGKSMTTSDLTTIWPIATNTCIASRRKASAYTMPIAISNQNPVVIDKNLSFLTDNMLHVTFTRPQVLSESSINTQQTQFIWAYSSSKPASDTFDSVLYKHDASGPFTLDLTKSLSEGSNPTSSFSSGKVLTSFDQLVISHAVLMFTAFGILMPVAIYIARFARNLSDWVRIHYGIQVFGTTALLFAGFWIGYVQSYGIHLKTNHQIIGVVIFIAVFIQAFLGFVIHHLYDSTRTHRPIRNWVHRILGAFIFILGLIQIPFGLGDYGAPMAANTAYYVWLGVLAFVFIMLTVRQTRNRNIQKVEQI